MERSSSKPFALQQIIHTAEQHSEKQEVVSKAERFPRSLLGSCLVLQDEPVKRKGLCGVKG